MRLLDNPVHFVSGNERVYWPTYECSVAQIFVQGIDMHLFGSAQR